MPAHPLRDAVAALLRSFRHHTEETNLVESRERLDKILVNGKHRIETLLVVDANRTLSAKDTGALFWQEVKTHPNEPDPLTPLFSSPMGYSWTAFRQASLLYEVVDKHEYDHTCEQLASTVTVHPEFLSLLRQAAENKNVTAVVMICGLGIIWEKILDREGLSETVKVLGGGRITDAFVMTPDLKAAMVSYAKCTYQVYVWAFGDSPMDLPMLKEADQAIVVVDEESNRSRTMDRALLEAIQNDHLQARQTLLPIQLTDSDFVDSVFARQVKPQPSGPGLAGVVLYHATKRGAANLLMTATRHAGLYGPALREAHRCVGWYLAVECLPEVVRLEDHPIPHVQGHQTSGHRLKHEQQALIAALMRGGKPMAFGVNDAFPEAKFLHAYHPGDMKAEHLNGQHTVILVDSVINSGKTVFRFVEHIHSLQPDICIVLVAGVVQKKVIEDGHLRRATQGHPNLSLVALRLSENQLTGQGATDTGNRLFNTMNLP